jgi:hypothetical protein
MLRIFSVGFEPTAGACWCVYSFCIKGHLTLHWSLQEVRKVFYLSNMCTLMSFIYMCKEANLWVWENSIRNSQSLMDTTVAWRILFYLRSNSKSSALNVLNLKFINCLILILKSFKKIFHWSKCIQIYMTTAYILRRRGRIKGHVPVLSECVFTIMTVAFLRSNQNLLLYHVKCLLRG